MKRTKKSYGSCLNTLQNLKYFDRSNAQQQDIESINSSFLNSDNFNVNDCANEKIPWKALALACFLAVGGIVQLTIGIFICTGHVGKKYEDRFWPFLILGVIMFLPGAYHLFIAFAAYYNIPGYSFSNIPDFD